MTNGNIRLEQVINDDSDDPKKLMTKIDKEVESVKFKAFGKIKEKSNLKVNMELVALHQEKVRISEVNLEIPRILETILMLLILLKKQKEVFEKELLDLKEMKQKKGKAAAIYRTKDKIVGLKALALEAVVNINVNLKTKADVVNPIEIKEVSLD